jgi:protein O-GlcNAc transferase
VDLTLDKQMQVIVNSDIVIGMHGAGMVNVLWTRPETLVIEIFPRLRKRWGYRNLCQFVGCDWHEFRGGTDIGEDEAANTKDKRIAYDEWRKFFDPLLRKRYAQVEAQQNPSV